MNKKKKPVMVGCPYCHNGQWRRSYTSLYETCKICKGSGRVKKEDTDDTTK